MKFFLVLLAFLWIPVGLIAQTSENKDPQVFHIGLSSATFDNLNQNDAMAAIKVWTDTVLKEQDFIEKAEVNFFNSFEVLFQAYKNDRVDAVSISTEDSMRLGLTPEFVYTPSREDGFTVSYAIIMHHNNAMKVGELGDKKLVIYAGQPMLMARLWLKSVLGKLSGTVNSRLENLITVDSPSKAILQVFFRQADAAIVTSEAFELACELNPQLRKNIRVLSSSPPLIVSFFVFRANWQGTPRERLESAIIALHTTPGGRQVLNIFGSSRMEKHPGTILDTTRQFLIENQQFIQHSPIKRADP